jgi:hypothetical protein
MRDQRGLEGVGRGHPVLVESATCDEVTALETDAVIVKGSAVLKGQFGVFAKKKFKRGETIFSVKGPVVGSGNSGHLFPEILATSAS